MSPESRDGVPDWVYIDASLETFSIGDQYGKNIDRLMRELRARESESVWAKRLALYEVSRRKAWIRSFTSLSERGIDGLLYPRFMLGEIRRLTDPGKVVSWTELDEVITGKNVILEHGSYASVPTMAHVGYVNYGTVGTLGAEVNMLSLDSADVIKGRKGGNKVVLADDLRTSFWCHVPGVDLVVVTPEFYPSGARKFWVEETYPRLSRQASKLTLMCSYGDQIAKEKYLYARLNPKLDVRVVYRENWAGEFGNPMYPQWTTSQWDEISGRHEEFERLAREYLVDLR